MSDKKIVRSVHNEVLSLPISGILSLIDAKEIVKVVNSYRENIN